MAFIDSLDLIIRVNRNFSHNRLYIRRSALIIYEFMAIDKLLNAEENLFLDLSNVMVRLWSD